MCKEEKNADSYPVKVNAYGSMYVDEEDVVKSAFFKHMIEDIMKLFNQTDDDTCSCSLKKTASAPN